MFASDRVESGAKLNRNALELKDDIVRKIDVECYGSRIIKKNGT
jgi:hypothetical protein